MSLAPDTRLGPQHGFNTEALRTVGADDEPMFFELYCDVRSEELGMQTWDSALRDQILRLQFTAQRRGYRQQYASVLERFVLRGGRPVGWIVTARVEHVVHCVDLAVLSSERRKGMATRALRAVQQEAAGGGGHVELSALKTNTLALALYGRLGFRRVRETDTHVVLQWGGDQPEPCLAVSGETASSDRTAFRTHLDSTFFADPTENVPLRLAEIVEEPVSGGMEQFSLFFHGPADRPLPQGTHVLAHAVAGTLALFLVPVIGSNRERIVYQACFSRPTGSHQ